MAVIDLGGATVASSQGLPIGATNYNITPSADTSSGTITDPYGTLNTLPLANGASNPSAGSSVGAVTPTGNLPIIGTGGLSSVTPTGNLPITGSNMSTNPLSMTPVTPSAGAVAPNLGVTAGSAPGAGGLTQGTALPNITTTQQQATATPQFYTDYLNQIAQQGGAAAQNAQYVGATDLQNQAFGNVQSNVGNYQPALTNATNLASSVGGTSLADAIGNYGQANIAANLAPQTTAGIVGSGQFGSSRGAGALGQVLANADLGITQQQQTALQQDQANKIAAANSLGNLATTTQTLGLGDTNALATLGAQQQTIGQNAQLFPMSQLTAESNLLKGATIPTATSSSYTGPIPGAYNASPLSQISGIGATIAGTGLGQTILGSPATGNQPANPGLLGTSINAAKNYIGSLGGATGSGITMDSNGNAVPGSYPLGDGGTITVNNDGSQSIKAADGTVQNFDANGQPYIGATDSGNPPPVIDPSMPTTDTGAIDYSGTNWGEG